jgi:hypothetical protein
MRKQHPTLFEQLADTKPARGLLCRMGLDPRQFILFLGLFQTLSEREELMSIFGVNRFSISHLSFFMAAILLVPWTFAVDSIPAPFYLLADLSITFALIFLIVVREAANTLFNPIEASILAHNPIHGPSYAAAKLVHILIAVLYLVLGLNAYPALIGFMNRGAHWYWLITHLASAFLIGLWTAFIICAVYGFMRRLMPASLLKNISMWIQLLAFFAFVAIPVFFPSTLFGLVTARFENSQWIWLPLKWFVNIGLMGCHGASWRLGWQGTLSVLVSIIVIWFGLRGFSSAYFSEAASMVQGRFGQTRNRNAFSRCCAALVRTVTGSPQGLGAFCFVSKMIWRDWQFRRAVLMQTWIPFLIILGLILAITRFGISAPGSADEPLPAYILPHLFGLIAMALCTNLPFTDFPKGSWIYLTAPIASMRAFARGVFWALWISAIGLPHIVLLCFFMRFVNWESAVFITGFNLLVVSLYLSFAINLVSGLPFSSPMNESRNMANAIYLQTCCIMATAFPITLHQYLCQRLWIALPATIALLIVFLFVLRINLGKLENEILWRLHLLKMGPNLLFREFE